MEILFQLYILKQTNNPMDIAHGEANPGLNSICHVTSPVPALTGGTEVKFWIPKIVLDTST